MATCERLEVCPLLHDRLYYRPASAAILKTQYCHGNQMACARYLVAKVMGPEAVPEDLFPNMLDRAEILLGNICEAVCV